MDSKKFQEVLAENAELAFSDFGLLKIMESPIEKLFATAFWSRYDWRASSELGLFGSVDVLKRYAGHIDPAIAWSPQVAVGSFRVDFMFCQSIVGDRPVLVAVECDGHEFHEKTKQQAARDKARDRKLAAHGIRVLRFTGSEIYRDANACADEVFRLLNDEWSSGVERLVASVATKTEDEAAE